MASLRALRKEFQKNVREKRFCLAKKMLEKKVKIIESSSYSMLYVAVEAGDIELVRFLLSIGANVNFRTSLQVTPLHIAVLNYDSVMVRTLLEPKYEANVNVRDSFGKTALNYAFMYSNRDIEPALMLLRGGVDPNEKNLSRGTPLHEIVTMNGNLRLITELIKSGAKINVTDNRGQTPLHKAFCVPIVNKKIVKLLLESGAAVDMIDYFGRTPLDVSNQLINNYRYSNLLCDLEEKKELLLLHIIKLKAAGFPVSVNIIGEMEATRIIYITDKCAKEFEEINNFKIHEEFTLSVVFSKVNEPFYLKTKVLSSKLDRFLHSSRVKKQFPFYHKILQRTFDGTNQQFKCLSKAAEVLNRLFIQNCGKSLPDLLTKQILYYLDNNDIKHLTRSESQELHPSSSSHEQLAGNRTNISTEEKGAS